MILELIGFKSGTDKSSAGHNLLVKYERFLGLKRYAPLNILEIGVGDGYSLNMWAEYFTHPETKILGIDINASLGLKDSRITLLQADQWNMPRMHEIGDKYGPFDMILDDASHVCDVQILCFQHMFKYIVKGGVYVIEDTCTSYWSEFNHGVRTTEFLKAFVDDLNYGGQKVRGQMLRGEYLLEPSYPRQFDMVGALFINNACLIYR